MTKIVPDRFAIMTVDPGGTTGCAQAVMRTDRGDDMLRSVLARAVKKHQISSWEESGESYEQAWTITQHWMNFRWKCNVEYGIALPDIHLVIESFQLRTKLADLASVGVINGMLTLLYSMPLHELDGRPWPLGEPEYQEPSTAKRVTNARLKDYGVWAVGSEHRRDALRHIVAKTSEIL